jgi:hypothetical protein
VSALARDLDSSDDNTPFYGSKPIQEIGGFTRDAWLE